MRMRASVCKLSILKYQESQYPHESDALQDIALSCKIDVSLKIRFKKPTEVTLVAESIAYGHF